MKALKIILPVFTTVILLACKAPLPVKNPVTREAPREAIKWTVVGSVRVEVYSRFQFNAVPYDMLFKEAHNTYGDKVDLIEIKEEKFKLDALTTARLARDGKGVFSYRYIYNALVIEYK